MSLAEEWRRDSLKISCCANTEMSHPILPPNSYRKKEQSPQTFTSKNCHCVIKSHRNDAVDSFTQGQFRNAGI